MGGAERVVEILYEILNHPTVFATVSNQAKLPPGLRSANINTSWMQHLPGINQYYRHYFPLYPFGVAGLNLSGYDLVVSSSSGYAKGTKTDANSIHVCYCYTPMRWVWRYTDYVARERFGFAQRFLLKAMLGSLKSWDENAARQPDQLVVSSTAVAERVWAAYRRRAVVIPPPIDVDRFSVSAVSDDFYLVLCRLVSYKRVDLAIRACNLLNRRLVVIGDGPDRQRLQGLAGPTVEFLGRVADDVVNSYAGRCRALIMPAEEDFGMVPLEVNAAGRPVIAYKRGGALDTVIEGVSGVFFEKDTCEALADAIENLESRSWSAGEIRRHAEGFDIRVFKQQFAALLHSLSPKWVLPDSPL